MPNFVIGADRVTKLMGVAIIALGGVVWADLRWQSMRAANGFKYFVWGADDLDSGIMAVKGKLQIVDGYPRFVFMEENLRWLKWEMGRYANRKLSRVNVITDKPEKRHDHLCDCLRYAAQHPMPHVPPPKRKRPRSWTEAYLKKKKQKKLSDAPGGGGVCCF